MIKKYSLKALQAAINHALSLDPCILTKMAPLHTKVLKIIIAPLDVTFYIQFEHSRLQLLAEYDKPADTVIHSSPLGLIRLSLLPASKVRSLFNDTITLSGDVVLGQQVKQLFDGIDIDWEGHLAHFTGDVVAYQIGSLFRQGLAFKRQVSASMQYNMTEYLQEELRIVPSHEEIEDFFHDIDALSLDAERLAARVSMAIKRGAL